MREHSAPLRRAIAIPSGDAWGLLDQDGTCEEKDKEKRHGSRNLVHMAVRHTQGLDDEKFNEFLPRLRHTGSGT